MRYRKTYVRKGTRVMGRCIRSQTTQRESSKNKTRRIRGRMTKRLRGVRKSLRTLKSCPKGYIVRTAFVRYSKKGKRTLVPDACIRNVGAPGKGLITGGPGIGPLRQGDLSKHGYSRIAQMSERDRHAALQKAIAEYGSLTVWRKLNALYVYTRRTSPATSMSVKQDMDWIRRVYGIKAF